MEETNKRIEVLKKVIKIIHTLTIKHKTEELKIAKAFIIKHYLDDFVQHNNVVYMINDFYIGKTKNLYNRILSHLEEAVNDTGGNFEKNKKIIDIIAKGKLKVSILSDNPNLEMDFIKEYYNNGYELTNKIGIPKDNKELKFNKLIKEINEEHYMLCTAMIFNNLNLSKGAKALYIILLNFPNDKSPTIEDLRSKLRRYPSDVTDYIDELKKLKVLTIERKSRQCYLYTLKVPPTPSLEILNKLSPENKEVWFKIINKLPV